MVNIVREVASCLERVEPPVRNMPVVVGVSGGADSLCLLHVLVALAPAFKLSVHVVHVEHGIRGQASRDDAQYVAEYCENLQVPCHVVVVDAPAAARQPGVSLEEAARQLRYEALTRIAAEIESGVIMLAHHADDQVETIVMHWLRGAGLGGLRGMAVESHPDFMGSSLSDALQIRLIRPLLEVWRTDIDAYCIENELVPRLDATNQDTTYLRNRLRHELIPLLETYNPRFKQVLLNSGRVLAGDYGIVSDVVDAVWQKACLREDDFVLLSANVLAQSSDAVLRAIIRRAVFSLRNHLRDVGWIHADSALAVIRGGHTGACCTLPGGLELVVHYDRVQVGPSGGIGLERHLPFYDGPARRLAYPGRGCLGRGWELECEICDIRDLPADWRQAEHPLVAYFDADCVGDLWLRTRLPGDRMRPLGLNGSRKLKDIMIDAQVPRAFRATLPVLESDGEIIWVVGIKQGEKACITEVSQRVLLLCVTQGDSAKGADHD